MDHAVLMGVLQSPGGLEHVVDRFFDGQRAGVLEQPGKVLAVNVLHGQVVDALVLAGVEGGDDVGMDQLGGGADLAAEPLDGLGRPDQLGRDHLQRHHPAHGAMLGLEHLAHAPGA